MDENIIDYGQWSIPTSWKELTLKQFQEIDKFYADSEKTFDTRDILHILTDKSMDDINSLPIEFYEKLLNTITWLYDAPQFDEPTNKIVVDGITYQVNPQEKLRTGEFVSVDSIIKADKGNYAAILAVLCRKEGEKYDSHFENEVLPSRIEMFEKQPFMKIMPIINFFFECYILLQRNSQMYLAVKELIDLTRKDIETSHKNGDLSKRSTKSLMKKLTKLEKSIKFT